MEIIFTNVFPVFEAEEPQPASNFIPDWYKKTESYLSGKKIPNGSGSTTATIKRCMPVFDAITSGYIITLPADVYVSQKENEEGLKFPYFEWSSGGLVEFHPAEQAPIHPDRNSHTSYPKWINPWAIKTPKGYSTLFVQPLHRESVFTIMPGVVDTDIYYAPVNFPFVLNDISFEGLIPKGTPIAQIIPFKRESWQKTIGSIEDFQNQQKITSKLQTMFFDRYKTMFRQNKEYR